MRISVIGLGYIGLPTGIVFAENGHDVFGYDISTEIVDSLREGRLPIVEEGLQEHLSNVISNGKFAAFNELQEAEAYIISVPTPFCVGTDKKKADLTYVMSAAKEIAKVIKKGDLVVLESTVPPLTTKAVSDLIEKESGLKKEYFHTVHCPERVLPGNIMREMVDNDRIIGSDRIESAEKAKALYESFLINGKVYITDDITAEMSKLVENSYRDVNIAFANELSIICDKLDIDVNKLIEVANKHPRVNILSPGVGVGGHCLAVDPWFIVEQFEKEARIINTAREINDGKPKYLANLIANNYQSGCKIAIFGMSYKPNIDDFRESPSIVLAKELKNAGFVVLGCDPNAHTSIIEGVALYTIEEAIREADLIIVAQKHKEFIEIEDKLRELNCIIL